MFLSIFVYLQGATVTANGKRYTSDANGYVTLTRGGEAVSGTVEAFGYAGNTFSFGAITSDTTHTVEVYAAVEIKFVVKFGSIFIHDATIRCGNEQGITNLYGECILMLGKGVYEYTITHSDYFTRTGNISVGTSANSYNIVLEPKKVDLKFIVRDHMNTLIGGATIIVDGLTGTTDSDGTCTLRVSSKQTHHYTVAKNGYFGYDGNVSVSTSTVTQPVTMPINIEAFKPTENNNIQLLFKGPDAVLNISSTTSDYVIDWGDGTSDNATGIGERTYNHTYTINELYQVEIKNCGNITGCNGTSRGCNLNCVSKENE